jgi:hypothetical protein
MKLIELIIKHVPRDDIHPDAKFFAQDTCSGVRILFQYLDMPKPKHAGTPGYWGVVRSVGNVFNMYEAAEDARNTVVTREQLNYLWILQDQGYTLVFDGSNPFQNPTDDLVDVIPFNFGPGQILHPRNVAWKNVTAYRVVKNESRSPIKEFSVDATVETKKRLELFDKSCDGVWPGKDWETFAVTVEGQIIKTDPGKIITRKMWDEYVSRKIRVGDKVTVGSRSSVVTVLHIGEKNAFVRYNNGAELAASLNRLTRVSE